MIVVLIGVLVTHAFIAAIQLTIANMFLNYTLVNLKKYDLF